ncbi:MAG: helix-turn-helix transcriptional regulator, partial [Firmicutes bacterium]|nr:helix-turn-helix transcriptional regulator [Bacillota bacterium]
MRADGAGVGRLRAVFGQRVREMRTRQGLTQQQLAQRAGMHPAYVGGIERGERNITLDGVDRLARALGVSPAELMASPREGATGGYEARWQELVYQARAPGELELALDVARFVLDRLHRMGGRRWEA